MSQRDFEVGDGAALTVKIQSGRVDVSNGEPGRIRVEILTKSEEAIEVTQSGDTVSVIDSRDGWISRGSVRIAAQVPPGADVEIGSASATVDVDADVGSLTCRTASGNITFGVVDDVTVKTASGTVRGRAVNGSAQLSSASGDVRIEKVGAAASVGVASGNVNVDDAGGDIRVTSASGNIRIEHFRGDECNLKTVSGNLTVGFPAGISLETDITTLTGSVRLPDSKPSEPPLPPEPGETEPRWPTKRRVRFAAKSVSGNIRIETFSH